MTAGRRASRKAREMSELGVRALKAGDPETARTAFAAAVKADRRNPGYKLNLGIALAGSGEIDEAVRVLTEALALKPDLVEAARRLASLLRRFRIEDASRLNEIGLRAAMAFERVDHTAMVELAIAHLKALPPLAEAVRATRAGKGRDAAAGLLLKRTSKALKSPLLLEALRRGPNTDPDFERLLTALRRVILVELPEARFAEDRALWDVLAALIRQCEQNELVWAVGAEEEARLASLGIDADGLLAGDPGQSRRLALSLLYRPLAATGLDGLTPSDCRRIKPKLIGAVLEQRLSDARELREQAEAIPVIGAIADPTSQKVSGQYEQSPYPRWTSFQASPPGVLRNALKRYFAETRLAFMDGPFDVLIAGAGTGRQTAMLASAYGENARIMGIDISRASLAYAALMNRKFGITTVELAQADILDAARLDRRFRIVESVGVLHHMADPFEGWRRLIDRLQPGGLMLIGL